MRTALFLAVLLLTGCASVPATKITFSPSTGAFTLDSPKDVHVQKLKSDIQNGKFTIALEGLSSTNSPDVIAAVAAANTAMAQQLVEALKVIEAMAAKGAK